MINPFKRIKNNSRYTYEGRTIIVENTTKDSVTYYDLLEWWEYQPIIPRYCVMKKWDFIKNVKRYKFK